MAIEMIQKSKQCGADTAKFQYYITDTLCLNRNCFEAYKILEKNKMHPSWIPLLKAECDRLHIEFACTAFCEYSAEEIAPYVESFKVASPEVCNISFIKNLASYGKPLILSTGKASIEALDNVFEITNNVILLYCVSKYPAVKSDYDLNVISELRKRYNCPVGLSDHTQGVELACEAIEKHNVCMIEKHFKLNNDCVDAIVSISPAELSYLCSCMGRFNRNK